MPSLSRIASLPDLKRYSGLHTACRKSPTSFLEAQNDITTSLPLDGLVRDSPYFQQNMVMSQYFCMAASWRKLHNFLFSFLALSLPLQVRLPVTSKKSMKSFCEVYN